ncbi:MAG: tripartite tricarboxylate transporter substrate binding protein [Bacteroidetes bacterium]|nr:tripartite tricarboxylate transporter substrate binding protein [Bacteroidota bacterium]
MLQNETCQTRRALNLALGKAVLGFVGTGVTAPAFAQTPDSAYPVRPVKIVVPFATGGPADNYARFIAQRLQERLGQAFVVENRPGAGSIIGTDQVAKSAPDGYTLLMMSNTHTVNETFIPNKPYSLLRDFIGVAPVNFSDLVLVAHPKAGVRSLGELIAKAKANPGKINYASSGLGTPYHLAGELFKSLAGIDLVHVPYKGSSNARTDVLAGHVDLMFDAVTTMAEQARSGKVVALATSGKKRSSVMPNIPTLHESGVLNYESTIWLGVVAPRATPRPIVNRLNDEIGRIVAQNEVRDVWAKQGASPILLGVDKFEAYIKEDVEKWSTLIKSANIRPE